MGIRTRAGQEACFFFFFSCEDMGKSYFVIDTSDGIETAICLPWGLLPENTRTHPCSLPLHDPHAFLPGIFFPLCPTHGSHAFKPRKPALMNSHPGSYSDLPRPPCPAWDTLTSFPGPISSGQVQREHSECRPRRKVATLESQFHLELQARTNFSLCLSFAICKMGVTTTPPSR